MRVKGLITYTAALACLALTGFTPQLTYASECTVVSVICTDDTPIVMNSVTIEGVCRERAVHSDCDTVGAFDSCTQFEGVDACTKTEDRCIQEAGGICIEERQEWDCINASPEFPTAQLLQRLARNVQDTITGDCQQLADDQNCSRISSTCNQPAETRQINHIPIARQCWGWERVFNCQVGDLVDTCTQYVADPQCSEVRSECLVEIDGRCTHWDVMFQCGEESGQPPEQCEGQTVCIGGICSMVFTLETKQTSVDKFGL